MCLRRESVLPGGRMGRWLKASGANSSRKCDPHAEIWKRCWGFSVEGRGNGRRVGSGVCSVCVKILQGDGETITVVWRFALKSSRAMTQVSEQNQCAHLYLLTVSSSSPSLDPAVTRACSSFVSIWWEGLIVQDPSPIYLSAGSLQSLQHQLESITFL